MAFLLEAMMGTLYEKGRFFISGLREKSLVMEMLKMVGKPVIQVSYGHVEI